MQLYQKEYIIEFCLKSFNTAKIFGVEYYATYIH